MKTLSTKNPYREIFELQGKSLNRLRASTAKNRIAKINRIVDYLSDPINEKKLMVAMHNDLRKPKEDVIASEIVPVLSQATYVKKNLKRWMRPKIVDTPVMLVGLTSRIQYEPKGRVLIIAPWNYPFQLAIWPLIYAIAAGCSAVLKPSEISDHVSIFIEEMISNLFAEDEVKVIRGGIPETTALLEMAWDHIHFTGSPQVGKIIMNAASKHLSSVTLELGGKSPAIVDKGASISSTANKLAWGKHLNCGQTCIAPDYLIVHRDVKGKLLENLILRINKLYDAGAGIRQSPYYGRIINESHFDRILGLLDDAIHKGAKVVHGGESDRSDLYIAPTIIEGVSQDMRVMNEEIFGPILPVMTFDNIADVPAVVKRLPKPLSLYIFSHNRKNIRYILDNISSGGAMVNDLMMGPVNVNLPFGGVNNSGIGKANGHHGFVDFCNEKGVMERRWGTLSMVYPPYISRVFSLLKWMAKRF